MNSSLFVHKLAYCFNAQLQDNGVFNLILYTASGRPHAWHLRCDLTNRSSERSDTSIHSGAPSLQMWQYTFVIRIFRESWILS